MSAGAVPASRLVLLRHGRTAWNDVGRAQGHTDVELDEAGHAQAAAAAGHLARWRPVALWSSDLLRARQTAAHLETATGLVAGVDARLREYDVGERQGMTMPEFEAAFPEEYASWRGGDDIAVVPGSETAADVEARILPALREMLARVPAGETGVVVGHGAALKIGLLGLLGWPRSQASSVRGLDNCAWATLATHPEGRPRLEAYGAVADRSAGGADVASAHRVG